MFFTARLNIFALAIPALLVLGLANSGVNVTVHPLLLQVTPRPFIGRAESLQNTAITLVVMVSSFGAGYLNSTLLSNFHRQVFGLSFGPVDTILAGVSLIALVAGWYAARGLRGFQPPISVRA